MTHNALTRIGRGTLWLILPLLIVAAIGIVVALIFRGSQPRPGTKTERAPDMALVLRLNNQGIAYLDNFKFPRAIKQFEILVAMAPDWLPGRINLGIALFN